jgi:selenide, water dikinase
MSATLVSPQRHTPYSGMLPGLIAGHYGFHDTHIDLERLAARASATFIQAEAGGLDAAGRALVLAGGGALPYDVLSVNTGSRPELNAIPGARDFGTPVKPVDRFLEAWERLRARAQLRQLRIAVVGGGAAGVELVLSMQQGVGDARLRSEFHLVSDVPELVPNHAPAARRILGRILTGRGVALHLGRAVVAAEPGRLHLAGGAVLEVDDVIWVLPASAPAWIARSGLATDPRGFVAVDSALRSLSHSEVFAAGDTATILDAPRPKSGVYAVRQGPVLARNLEHALRGKPLTAFAPQRRALALISTGDRRAVASYGPLAAEGAWIWRWKDRIDRRFMARYERA